MKFYAGLEIHLELSTRSKLFCSCPIPDYQSSLGSPNNYICPICIGEPGTLPAPNQQALELALKMALALKTTLATKLVFARKNYFYPDMPKNYQISQHNAMLGENGVFQFSSEGQEVAIAIKELHLEEDTAKLIYPEGRLKEATAVWIDFNRSGLPLLEVVTFPFLTTPSLARKFLEEFQKMVRFLGVSKANMEEGALRVDVNISLPDKEGQPGSKVEVKNLNSFRFVEKALSYEAHRQSRLLAEGKKIVQETRGFLEKEGLTTPQRRKEEVSDYRYFPDPDLPAYFLSAAYIASLRETLPRLPQELKRELIKVGLEETQADILTQSPMIYDYFMKLKAEVFDGKEASSWLINEVLPLMADKNSLIDLLPDPTVLARLILQVKRGEIIRTSGREMLKNSVKNRSSLEEVLSRQKTILLTETDLTEIITQVLSREEKAVSDYRQGKDKAFKYLLGQVMKECQGKAKPEEAERLLLGELKTT